MLKILTLPFKLRNQFATHKWRKDFRLRQDQWLLRQMQQLQGSRWAKDHGLDKINSTSDFRDNVPLQSYADLEPYISRVFYGDERALFSHVGQIRMFALSSGTTSNRKFIPVTRQCLSALRASFDFWRSGLLYDHPELMFGKVLALTSDWQQFYSPLGVPCGDMSGISEFVQRKSTKRALVLPAGVKKIAEQEKKFHVSLKYALAEKNIRIISTATPATIVQAFKWMNDWQESLLRDLHQEGLLKRVHELERIRDKYGFLYPKVIWPHLKVVATWCGGSMQHYVPRMQAMLGDEVCFRDIGLRASEGQFNLVQKDNTNVGLLNVAHNFYEFVPQESYDPSQKKLETLLPEELTAGRNYFIVVTTSGGLVRYDMQDLVRCESMQGGIPQIAFLQKAKHITDISGEKVSEYQVVSAFKKTVQKWPLHIDEFCLVADHQATPPCYELLVEEKVFANPEQEKTFCEALDQNLQQENFIYQEHRQGEKLGVVKMRLLKQGAFGSIRNDDLQKRRSSVEQYKALRLLTMRDVSTQYKRYFSENN